jgi:DMSO/TMAO reductase YedYZ molybdopterin-dependent catalytic subunit
MLTESSLSRRDMIKGSVALAAAAFSQYPLSLFGGPEAEEGGVLIPFLNAQPAVKRQTRWAELTSWKTADEDLYVVSHYNTPDLKADNHHLEITGLVKKPITLSLDQIKSRKKQSLYATLECGGNGASTGFMGAVGNVEWTGTPLAPLLKECSPLKRGIEVVFFGSDEKTETIRKKDYRQNFARSLHVADAMRDDILLVYEMNGQPLMREHGFPLRLIVPGWYGISWVKWLKRIEILDRRFMGKYMAREYVTLRGEERDGQTVWRETSVCFMNVKSIIGRAVRLPGGTVRLTGAAWDDGTPLERVEVKIDDGPWQLARLEKKPKSKYTWTFFSYDWTHPESGEHTVVSRATDRDGRVQLAADDPAIKLKQTYWEACQQYPWQIRL